MKVKIKKLHEDAVVPSYSKPGDAGLDLTAVTVDEGVGGYFVINTQLAVEIPEGYVGLVFPRSGIYKRHSRLCNSVGVIDSGYRGPIKLVVDTEWHEYRYKPGDRVGQLVIIPYPQVEFEEVTSLSESARGEGGFGSTGA